MAANNFFWVNRPDVIETSADVMLWAWFKLENLTNQPGASVPQGGEATSQYLVSLWGTGIDRKQIRLMHWAPTQKMSCSVSSDGSTTDTDCVVATGDQLALNNWYFSRGHHDGTNNQVVCWENETNSKTESHTLGIYSSLDTNPKLVLGGNSAMSGGSPDAGKVLYGKLWQAGIILPTTTTNWDDIGTLLYNSGAGRTAQQCLRDTSGAEQTNYGLTSGRCWFFELNETSGDTTSKITALTLAESGTLTAICGVR